jgi:murein L,D-transpeptidase YcbB/YkuD
MGMNSFLKTVAGAMALTSVFAAVGVRADVREDILEIVEASSLGEERHLLPEPVRAAQLIEVFYHGRDYQLAWQDTDQIKRVLAVLADSKTHGLNPEDYHYSALQTLVTEWKKKVFGRDRVRARFDVLLSDGVLLYARHQREGKVDPAKLEVSWNFNRIDLAPERIIKNLSNAIDQQSVVTTLKTFEPPFELYLSMRDTLKLYRNIDDKYDFEPVPDDVVLKLGMTHANVTRLRESLRRLELWQGDDGESQVFDEGLLASVKRFQALHSLDIDGVVGGGSFRELNTSYADRIDQIRINLDRLRWVRETEADDMVVVNIAGFEMYYFVNGAKTWETEVMVGTTRNETPVFQSKIKYLVFNPTWTVPRSIIRKSLFRKMQKDPNYVREKNYKLYDSDGQEADPATMDWASYSPGRFPYRVVQQPGPGNALGRVKFIFPNKYAVYLHDTPSRALFERTERAFSHGCIRVQHPLHFAQLLLDDEDKWSRANIDAVIESGTLQNVHLKEPLEVMLMYWTASPGEVDRIQFHQDVYKRDAKAIAALKEEPRWDAN